MLCKVQFPEWWACLLRGQISGSLWSKNSSQALRYLLLSSNNCEIQTTSRPTGRIRRPFKNSILSLTHRDNSSLLSMLDFCFNGLKKEEWFLEVSWLELEDMKGTQDNTSLCIKKACLKLWAGKERRKGTWTGSSGKWFFQTTHHPSLVSQQRTGLYGETEWRAVYEYLCLSFPCTLSLSQGRLREPREAICYFVKNSCQCLFFFPINWVPEFPFWCPVESQDSFFVLPLWVANLAM